LLKTQNKIAKDIALQKAMEGEFKNLPHGCKLFYVEKGWESKILAEDVKFVKVDTLLSLENAIRDEDNKVIFIPIDALITDDNIEKLCQRNAIIKIFFKEVG